MKITIEDETCEKVLHTLKDLSLWINGIDVNSRFDVLQPVEEKKEETCKWKTKKGGGIDKTNPHSKETWYIQDLNFNYCPTCGKRIEVVQ